MDLIEVPKTSFRRHPWEVARSRFFCEVLERAGVLEARVDVLDVGAGDGYLAATLLEKLSAGSKLVCFDAHYTDDDLARFGRSTPAALSFSRTRPHQRFDVVLLLDVIEHVENDRQFLTDFVAENMTEGGVVLVSVPAWHRLFTQHDVNLRHFRRYNPGGVQRLLEQADLVAIDSGGLFHIPLVPRAWTALREAVARRLGRTVRPSAHSGQWTAGPVLSRVVERILVMDNALSARMAALGWRLPGLSFWALCRRRKPPQ